MRFEYEGTSLWYGTADAPAPEGPVQAGTELTMTVGVQPWNAGNNVEVLYRMNQGLTEHIAAKWSRNDSLKKSQYFRAHFPTFRVGDTVEYIAVCRRAGRQVVPPSAQTEHFASSFHMIDAGAKREHGSAPEAIGPRGAIRPNLRPVNGNGNGPPEPKPGPDQSLLNQLTLASFTATPSTVATGISELVMLAWQVTVPDVPRARSIRFTLETPTSSFPVGPVGSQSIQVSNPMTFSLVAHLGVASQTVGGVSITAPVQPEIAIESSSCLGTSVRPIFLSLVNQQLQKLKSNLLPNPIAYSICWQQNQEHGGIWFYSAYDDNALQQLPDFLSARPGPSFAFNISPSAISRITNSVWQQQQQKADSRYTLRDLTTSFESPNRIVLKITGTVHTKVLFISIDTDFTVTNTIYFEVVSGRVLAGAEQHVDVDTSLVTFIEVLVPPATPFLDFEVAKGESQVPPNVADSGNLIASVLPTKFLLPGVPGIPPQKLVFTYDQRQVDSVTGILLSGPAPSPQPRQPTVDIAGDTDITYPHQKPVSVVGQYFAITDDLREPFTSVVWQSSGRIIATDGAAATIGFHTTVGELTGTVSVSVTDQDGLMQSQTVQVTIHKSGPPGKGGRNS